MPWISDRGYAGREWVPDIDHAGGGVDSQYHPEIGDLILRRLGEGETVRALCAEPDMPCKATLRRWRQVHPEFGAAYAAMRDNDARHRRMMARLKRERWLEWVRIEVKIGRRKGQIAKGGGPRSTYERGWAEAFCARVAQGEAVYRIVAEAGMPSRKQVYGWLRRQPEFEAMYMAAKREAADWLRFQAMIAADEVLDESLSPARFAEIKREVARIEGQAGLLAAKTYR